MDIEQARRNMITQQVRTWGVVNQDVLEVMANTPREAFVPHNYKKLAFVDACIPLGHGQVMFMPMEEARILQALDVQASDSVLEIGTGSGYLTALLAKLGKYIYSIDIFPDFCSSAKSNLDSQNIRNIEIINRDGALGWEEQSPYDIIVISGSLTFLPENFRKSLKPGGRIFAILGNSPAMEATLLTYTNKGDWLEDLLFETVVPPLLNAPELSHFRF